MEKMHFSRFFRLFFGVVLTISVCHTALFAENEEVSENSMEEIAEDTRNNEEKCSDLIHEALNSIDNKWTEANILRLLHSYAFSQKKTAQRPFPDYSILRDIQWHRLTVKNADGSQGLVTDPSLGAPLPQDSLENIEIRTKEACKNKVSGEFNMEEQKNALMRDADRRFKLYRQGEVIPTLVLHKGKGPTITLENVVFMELGSERIKLSKQYINRADLDRETEAKFDPVLNEKVKNEFIEEGMKRLNRDLEVQIEMEVRRQLPLAFKEAGWIPNILDKGQDAGWNNTKPAKWTKISDLVKKFRDLKIKRDKETKVFDYVKSNMLKQHNLKPVEKDPNNNQNATLLQEAPISKQLTKSGKKVYYICDYNDEDVSAFFAVSDTSAQFGLRKILWVPVENFINKANNSGSED